MDDLRAEFPVLERLAYLNSGTNGPAPSRAIEAAAAALRTQAELGRGDAAFFDPVMEQIGVLRGRIAAVMGCDPGELAITGSTSDGVNTVLSAVDLGPGDEVVTSDEEHPGVLAPLASAARRRGIGVRVAPFDALASAVGPATRLIACSHVSWHRGRVVDAEALAATGVPLLLDGAQGLGAVPVGVRALGCDFYAASGQKWLCGPNGLGYLYVRRERADSLLPPWPGYMALSNAERPLDLDLHEGARRLDMGVPAAHQLAWALAALDVLEEAGLGEVQERAATLAERLAGELAARGAAVAPRGRSTLVAWEDPEPAAAVERLRERGFVLRALPGTQFIRASVGGWTSEDELERLLEAAL